MTLRHTALLVLLVASVAAWAGAALATDTGRTMGRTTSNVAVGYHPSEATAAYRSALDGGDVANITSTTPSDPGAVTCRGYQTVAVGGTAAASAATVEVCFTRYYDNGTETVRLSTIRTLTADDTWCEGDATSYVIPASYFDTCGATEVRVRAADPSSGTVTLRLEVY